MRIRHTNRFFLALALALLGPWTGLHAQGYPSRPIQLPTPSLPSGPLPVESL